MFDDPVLAKHLKNNHTLKLRTIVLSEWNMNEADNIKYVGVYRYRQNLQDIVDLQSISEDAVYSSGAKISPQHRKIFPFFDEHDVADSYTNATKSTLFVDAGYKDDEPFNFLAENERMTLLYDLESCVDLFRPRSGINKVMLNIGRPQYTDKFRSAERPRFYVSSKKDQFKYWNSFKTEGQDVYGVSTAIDNTGGGYQIQDAVPFVVYKEMVPANRITVKVQTKVGSFSVGTGDPLYGTENSTVPKRWRIEYLTEDNVWVSLKEFNESSTRIDGSPIIDWDGHVEIKYGFKIPEKYQDNFWFVDYLTNEDMLPPIETGVYVGEAYAVVTDQTAGTLYIMNENNEWEQYPVEYEFSVLENDDYGYGIRSCVSNVVDPPYFLENDVKKYREFIYLKGIRIVVDTMNTPNTMFELIEMSPRLVVDLTKYTTDFEFNRSIHNSDTELPIGDFIASNGSISLENYDLAFSKINENSIISKHLKPNVKFIFFEGVRNVGIYEKLIPIKWLYAEDFPTVVHRQESVSIDLRDLTFLFENKKSPEIFLRNVPLTAALMILMDSIGFSNYRFIGFTGDNDPILPNFFVGPSQNIAEVLKNIAIATQTAMFFDEYNNFTVYSKNYLFDENREINIELNIDEEVSPVCVENEAGTGICKKYEWVDSTGNNIGIQNVISITPEKLPVINDGTINFTTRYIQRSVTKVKQASKVGEEREYGYKPILLWEVAPTDSEKSTNGAVEQQEGFVLGAVTINSDIEAEVPTVVNNEIVNNIIDVGANIFWLPRHQGYLYANGEIIKYDAIEYVVTGQTESIWINNNREYQKYFGSLPFNGTIYPTGNIRIYAEPYYESINGVIKPKNGDVRAHGRAQFGTAITSHVAGINPEWTNNANVKGLTVDSLDIFSTSSTSTAVPRYVYTPVSGNTSSNDIALRSKRVDVIKNFMSSKVFDEGSYLNVNNDTTTRSRSRYNLRQIDSSALRASALVFSGPQQFNGTNARDFITYVNKSLDQKYTHFGTRMRIIGEIDPNETTIQSPLGAMNYFNTVPDMSDEVIKINGGSGGLGIMLNENSGYFLEIMSLTKDTTKQFIDLIDENSDYTQLLENVVLWKKSPNSSKAKKIWGGTTSIYVDSGTFVGQERASKEEHPTVYDLAIEYRDEGNKRKFTIFINGKQIATDIEDKTPLTITPNFGPFIRGSSKCMFENIYAIGPNPAWGGEFSQYALSNYFRKDLNIERPSEVFRKFSMNSFITDSYLTSLNTQNVPKFILYYEEFGTILRECFYFNIKYDNAYPALYAKIAPTFNRERSYSIAGFVPTPYGAEFLVINNTDKATVLDETTGSFLRITGIGFTQDTTYEYTVDEYFKKVSRFSENKTIDVNLYAENPNKIELDYKDIKASRSIYGTNGFTLESDYIQTWQQADELMGWIIGRRFKPKNQYTLQVFGVPHLQLGDIVNIYYKDVIDSSKKFVVMDIDHNRQLEGIESTIRVTEI